MKLRKLSALFLAALMLLALLPAAAFAEAVREGNTISEVYVNNFTLPVYGEHPAFDVTVPDGAPYTVVMAKWAYPSQGSYTELFAADVFNDPTAQYTFGAVLLPLPGYSFASSVTVYVNGSTDPVRLSYSGPQLAAVTGYDTALGFLTQFYTVTASGEPTEPEEPTQPDENVITEVRISNFTVPAFGQAPDYNLLIPENAHYSFSMKRWEIRQGDQFVDMGDGTLFDDLTATYAFGGMLVADEGYTFASNTAVYINGSTDLVRFVTAGDPSSCGFMTRYFTLTAPAVEVAISEASWREHDPEDGRHDLRFVAEGVYTNANSPKATEIGFVTKLGDRDAQTIHCGLRFFNVDGLTFSYVLYINNVPKSGAILETPLEVSPYVMFGNMKVTGETVSDILGEFEYNK